MRANRGGTDEQPSADAARLDLADGEPDDPPEVLRLLALCRQAGMETVGVGIGICVKHLFPTAIEVT